MRRTDRALNNYEILQIIQSCKVFRIAMTDGARPYIVPLNYGYEEKESRLTFYFHCAKEGRKLDCIKANPAICFEMDTSHQLVEADIACMYGYLYASVIGEGTASIVEDETEKAHALTLLMRHQAEKEFTFNHAQTNAVTVCRIDVSQINGKSRRV